MADYLNDQYLNPDYDTLPTGQVDWTNNTYISRCGLNRWGKIETGYCGKAYRFRSCWVMGREMRAYVCTRCDLRRSIVTTGLGRKKDLCKELASLVGCTPAEAFAQAYAAFSYLAEYRKPNLFPLESGVEKVVEFNYDSRSERLPYRD